MKMLRARARSATWSVGRDGLPLDDAVVADALRDPLVQRPPVGVVVQVEHLEALGVRHLVAVGRGEPRPGAGPPGGVNAAAIECVRPASRASCSTRRAVRPRPRGRGGPAGRRRRRRRCGCCRAAAARQTPMPTIASPRTPPAASRSCSGSSSGRATRECSQAGYTSYARSAAAAWPVAHHSCSSASSCTSTVRISRHGLLLEPRGGPRRAGSPSRSLTAFMCTLHVGVAGGARYRHSGTAARQRPVGGRA